MFKKLNKAIKSLTGSVRKRFEEKDRSLKRAVDDQDDLEVMSSSQELFLQNIQKVHDLTVDDLKIPRVDIMAINKNMSKEDLVTFLRDNPFQLYPVYQKNLDDVVGVMHIKDIAHAFLTNTYNAKHLMRDVLFVSASMKTLDLLIQMRTTGHMMAMVVDEYGGIDGLITAWDIIEELIGETDEEEDLLESPQMVRLQDGTYVADARLLLEDFEEQFGAILTADEKAADLDTLGGLVIYLAGRVPDHKEIIEHSKGIEFEVLEANPRRVLRLRVRRQSV